MFRKTLVILYILYNVSDIEGDPGFRNDYKFSELAFGWFKLHRVPATWSDAKMLCHAEGARLASPLTHQIRDALVQHVATKSSSSIPAIFTGVHSTYSKGVYASIEGVRLSKLPVSWASGEPDNYMNSESCLTMLMTSSNNGTMTDSNCNEVFPFVCYKKKTHALLKTACGTVDTEYTFDPRSGKCYKFHRRGLTWSRAYMTCMAEGGHLAVVNSEDEFNLLRELFAKNTKDMILSRNTDIAALGFSDPNDGESWVTIHGDTLKEAGFERWQSGEPNNASQPEGELCGVMYRGNGNFYDAPCSWPLAFICEMTPDVAYLDDTDEMK